MDAPEPSKRDTVGQSLEQARAIVAEFASDSSSVVESLIADRRAENARDEAETAAWRAEKSGCQT